ncbi:hypothetical protein [Rhizobium fabae]|uniref:Uncharacterized protein n=1 Tax=Rhizobium fabae TaxID=573179 RepID=A0A7W6FHG3_9HYPH|nr:hypothetical protein [Rhizobium fabae]MBB3914088.1 hypothetical protein [Rhizobium fabae]
MKRNPLQHLVVRLKNGQGESNGGPRGRVPFVSVHPSYLLRNPDERPKVEEMARFREDMLKIQLDMTEFGQTDSDEGRATARRAVAPPCFMRNSFAADALRDCLPSAP